MSIRSMTGFASAERRWLERNPPTKLSVELRSVNSRFLELKIRQPFGWAVEHKLRTVLENRMGRGRVDLLVRIVAGENEMSEQLELRSSKAKSGLAAYGLTPENLEKACAALTEISEVIHDAGLEVGAIKPLELLEFCRENQDRLQASQAPRIEPELLLELVEQCTDRFDEMRSREGQALCEVLNDLLNELEHSMTGLRENLIGESERLSGRLRARITELCQDSGVTQEVDHERVAQEVAVLISRGDIAEEFDRVRSHLKQARGVLAGVAQSGQGKTLDFLAQELHREVTTMGSKVTSHQGSAIVIQAKTLVERIREQVQNVE